MFDLIRELWRRHGIMTSVVVAAARHAADVVGVITKEHVADSVAESIRCYPE